MLRLLAILLLAVRVCVAGLPSVRPDNVPILTKTGAPNVACLDVTRSGKIKPGDTRTLTVEQVRGSDWGGGVGGVLYSLRSGTPSFAHYNRRGDVTARTNGAGVITWQASYEAGGKRTAEIGATQERQKANTKDEDPTGLLNEGMRYRDLETCTFITRDPAGFVDGPNLYAYVRQNPWSAFDPEGLWYMPPVPVGPPPLVAAGIVIGTGVIVLGGGLDFAAERLDSFAADHPLFGPAPGPQPTRPLKPGDTDCLSGYTAPRDDDKPKLATASGGAMSRNGRNSVWNSDGSRKESKSPEESARQYVEASVKEAVEKAVHGNSNASTKPQHGYEIFEIESGNVFKTGISGQELNKTGDPNDRSPRANSQVNSWNKEAGYERFGARVIENVGNTRFEAKQWEQENTNRLDKEGHTLDFQKTPQPSDD